MLAPPDLAGLFSHWTVQPVALVVVALLAVNYVRNVRRLPGGWPVWRGVVFFAGLALLLWTSCGFPQVYASSLYWVWTAQTLTLWLVVPVLVLSGHPVQLARAVGRSHAVDRILSWRGCRIVGNPLVGPALVPLLSGVLFFGPLPGWAIMSEPCGWLVQLALLAVGALMVQPLVGLEEDASSLVVGLALFIGSFELVLDALPGVILRLHEGIVTSFFAYRDIHYWTPPALHDQRVAGAVLWCIAEIIDLPYLLLVFRRWLRADARDAAEVDAVLEAERAARRAIAPDEPEPVVERDAPWWLTDPAMQQRIRRQKDA